VFFVPFVVNIFFKPRRKGVTLYPLLSSRKIFLPLWFYHEEHEGKNFHHEAHEENSFTFVFFVVNIF